MIHQTSTSAQLVSNAYHNFNKNWSILLVSWTLLTAESASLRTSAVAMSVFKRLPCGKLPNSYSSWNFFAVLSWL